MKLTIRFITTILISMTTLMVMNPQKSQAQSNPPGKWHVKTGISSYHINSLPEFDSGTELSTQISYRMHTGFDLGLGYSLAVIDTKYKSSSPFADLIGREFHHSIRLMVGYHFSLGSQHHHVFSLGTGAFILGEQYLQYDIIPTAILELENGEQFYQFETVQYKQNQLFHIAGFLFNADYIFRFHENLAVGLRLESQFLFDYGFDRYSIGPKLVTFF